MNYKVYDIDDLRFVRDKVKAELADMIDDYSKGLKYWEFKKLYPRHQRIIKVSHELSYIKYLIEKKGGQNESTSS